MLNLTPPHILLVFIFTGFIKVTQAPDASIFLQIAALKW